MLFFDAHLDLACLTVNGRNMNAAPEAAGGPWQPGAVTLPSLREGNVRVALATIFTEPNGTDREGYPAGNVDRAHAVGRAQLEVYETWRDEGKIAIDLPALLRRDDHVGEVRGGMGVGEAKPFSLEQRVARSQTKAPLHVGILIENADPIRAPDELAWWKERGVVAVGLTWARSSRYATGNAGAGGGASAEAGLSGLGRDLAVAIDELGLIHDVSHLSDKAFDDLLAITSRPVIASHSNCRALLTGDMGPGGPSHRHLRDDQIKEIVRRGGVIGLNLLGSFVAKGVFTKDSPRPSVEHAINHVEHICAIAGHRRAVGLGSDMDGGISASDLPMGIDRPVDLVKLAAALSARGWSEDEVIGFAHANWARALGDLLGKPASAARRGSVSAS